MLLFLLLLSAKRELLQERLPEESAAIGTREMVEMRREKEVREPRQGDEEVVGTVLGCE